MDTHQNESLAHPYVVMFSVDEGPMTAMGDNGRESHCTRQATIGEACLGHRGGSTQFIEWWPFTLMQ
jgi:hypothetical protein